MTSLCALTSPDHHTMCRAANYGERDARAATNRFENEPGGRGHARASTLPAGPGCRPATGLPSLLRTSPALRRRGFFRVEA